MSFNVHIKSHHEKYVRICVRKKIDFPKGSPHYFSDDKESFFCLLFLLLGSSVPHFDTVNHDSNSVSPFQMCLMNKFGAAQRLNLNRK